MPEFVLANAWFERPGFGWKIRLDPGSISKRLQSTQVIEIANT
jgi:hypothetical protein